VDFARLQVAPANHYGLPSCTAEFEGPLLPSRDDLAQTRPFNALVTDLAKTPFFGSLLTRKLELRTGTACCAVLLPSFCSSVLRTRSETPRRSNADREGHRAAALGDVPP
jgi:hypothetical protein